MKFLLIIYALLASLFCEAMSDTVSCETIESEGWWGSMRVCNMQETTTINSEDFVISPADSSIQVIEFNGNKNIQFLPKRVGETFSSLVGYGASSCSIKDVSKKNFKNLNKLKRLDLDGNQIEQINGDTFVDLTSLEELYLHGNKIKKMNGAAFKGLNRISAVYLNSNVCIDKRYTTPTAFARLSQEIDANCGFTEVEGNSENSPKLRDAQLK